MAENTAVIAVDFKKRAEFCLAVQGVQIFSLQKRNSRKYEELKPSNLVDFALKQFELKLLSVLLLLMTYVVIEM